jgi:hypothetical protein
MTVVRSESSTVLPVLEHCWAENMHVTNIYWRNRGRKK